jgi:hypothetical protein
MPNHVDEADNKSRNHIPLDMLGIPKPILGINDEIKSSNAAITSLVTATFDPTENIIYNTVIQLFTINFSYQIIT